MEFLFIIVIGVIFVVQLAVKQMRKDDSSGSPLWGGGAATTKSSRPRPHREPRPRPQTSQPKNLEEALRLSEDRPAPPSTRYAGLDDDDDGPAEVRSRGAAAPGDSPVMAEAPRAEEDASRVSEDSSEPVTNLTVRTQPAGGAEPAGSGLAESAPAGAGPAGIRPAGADPAGTGASAPGPAGTLRPSEPFSPAYSTSVYTPTSVYSSYTPTSLYTSGTSILDGGKQAEPGEGLDDCGAHEQEPDEGQRS